VALVIKSNIPLTAKSLLMSNIGQYYLPDEPTIRSSPPQSRPKKESEPRQIFVGPLLPWGSIFPPGKKNDDCDKLVAFYPHRRNKDDSICMTCFVTVAFGKSDVLVIPALANLLVPVVTRRRWLWLRSKERRPKPHR
jgi:hypothetical protein